MGVSAVRQEGVLARTHEGEPGLPRGRSGLPLIQAIAAKKQPGAPVNVLTHCNAGWLATVDVGTATAPIYAAHDKGIAVHIFADETARILVENTECAICR